MKPLTLNAERFSLVCKLVGGAEPCPLLQNKIPSFRTMFEVSKAQTALSKVRMLKAIWALAEAIVPISLLINTFYDYMLQCNTIYDIRGRGNE